MRESQSLIEKTSYSQTLMERNTLKESNSMRRMENEVETGKMNEATVEIGEAAKMEMDMNEKPKTPLKKEELEQIAKQLKKKLSKASATAKKTLSPVNMRNRMGGTFSSPLKSSLSSSSPIAASDTLSPNSIPYSPRKRSPTQRKTLAVSYLSSSPFKNGPEEDSPGDSPSNRRTREDVKKQREEQPRMILEHVEPPLTPPGKDHNQALKLSPPMSSAKQQRTPVLSRKQMFGGTPNILLKTPTQSRPTTNGYNDEEGADLLMYLATSPSPSKPRSGTPKWTSERHNAPSSGSSVNLKSRPTTASSGQSSDPNFAVPAIPLTPKRYINSSSRTPRSRLTPSSHFFNSMISPGGGLPSSGLTLTPAGFNLNDYVDFFTPSPGNNGAGNGLTNTAGSKGFLKTPDFNAGVSSNKQKVDGRMINFDKLGFFGSTGAAQENSTKEWD